MEIKPCDIILTSKDNIFVKFMRLLQSDPVMWGHALIVAEGNTAYAFGYTMEELILDRYLKKKKHYVVFRYKYMTQDKAHYMLKAARKLKGISYGWQRIPLYILDYIFNTRAFTKLIKDSKTQVCSSFVAWLYYVAFKTKFNGADWRSVDPDDIDDHCCDSQDWTIITEV